MAIKAPPKPRVRARSPEAGRRRAAGRSPADSGAKQATDLADTLLEAALGDAFEAGGAAARAPAPAAHPVTELASDLAAMGALPAPPLMAAMARLRQGPIPVARSREARAALAAFLEEQAPGAEAAEPAQGARPAGSRARGRTREPAAPEASEAGAAGPSAGRVRRGRER